MDSPAAAHGAQLQRVHLHPVVGRRVVLVVAGRGRVLQPRCHARGRASTTIRVQDRETARGATRAPCVARVGRAQELRVRGAAVAALEEGGARRRIAGSPWQQQPRQACG